MAAFALAAAPAAAARGAVSARATTRRVAGAKPAPLRRSLVVRAEGPADNTQSTSPIVQEAVPVAVPVTAAASPIAPPPAARSVGFGEAMAFSGAPEIINGRLAMLAFVAALGAELATGEPVVEQLMSAPVLVAVTAVLFTWASLVPVLKAGGDVGKEFGPFKKSSELINGRAAMIGFASLLVIEGIKHTALF